MNQKKLIKIYEEVICNIKEFMNLDTHFKMPTICCTNFLYDNSCGEIGSDKLMTVILNATYDYENKDLTMKSVPVIFINQNSIELYLKYLSEKGHRYMQQEEIIYKNLFIEKIFTYLITITDTAYSEFFGEQFNPFNENGTIEYFNQGIDRNVKIMSGKFIKLYYPGISYMTTFLAELWNNIVNPESFKKYYMERMEDEYDN